MTWRNISWPRMLGLTGVVLVVLSVLIAQSAPTTAGNSTKGPAIHRAVTASSPAVPELIIIEVTKTTTEGPAKGTVERALRETYRLGKLESCDPCRPGMRPGMSQFTAGGQDVTMQAVKFSTVGNPSASGRATVKVSITHGTYCVWGGNCSYDVTYNQFLDFSWAAYYGVTVANGINQSMYGCAYACHVYTWHNSKTAHGYQFFRASCFGVNNDVSCIWYRDAATYGMINPFDPSTLVWATSWGHIIAFYNGTYAWDAGSE